MKKENPAAGSNEFSWRVPAIDGLRALAMLMVYTYHVWLFSNKPVKNIAVAGHKIDLLGAFQTFPAGVDFFMVLSGFCLFLPLCKSDAAIAKWDVRKYFARRFKRIAPPYYLAIVYSILMPQVLVIIYHALGLKSTWRTYPSLWDLIAHLLFIHTLFVSTWDGITGAFWSLGLEAQFYVVFPLVVFGFRKFGTRFIWGMFAVSVLYRIGAHIAVPHPSSWSAGFLISIFFIGRWMQFAAGMGAAWFVANHWKAEQWRSAGTGTSALVGALVIYCVAVTDTVQKINVFPLRDLLLAICFAVVIAALCVTKTPLRKLFENKAMVWLGFISYSFFLVHQPTSYYLTQLVKTKVHLHDIKLFFAMCSGGFLIVLGISYLFFLLCEKPFLNSSKAKNTPLPDSALAPAGGGVATVQDQAVP